MKCGYCYMDLKSVQGCFSPHTANICANYRGPKEEVMAKKSITFTDLNQALLCMKDNPEQRFYVTGSVVVEGKTYNDMEIYKLLDKHFASWEFAGDQGEEEACIVVE